MSDKQIPQPSPEMVEGPFYAHGGPYRSDLCEDQPGQKLDLTITVVATGDGAPVVSVDVDLWQCNATGHYSGYDVDPDELPENISNGQPTTNDETFLRGRQTTNARGQVTFRTVYPGWYALRTPHIHLKIFEGENCNTTTQLYLPEKLNQSLSRTPDYARRGSQDTFNNTDPVIANTPGDLGSSWVDVVRKSGIFLGSATVAVTCGNVNDLIIVPPGRIPPLGGRPHDKSVR